MLPVPLHLTGSKNSWTGTQNISQICVSRLKDGKLSQGRLTDWIPINKKLADKIADLQNALSQLVAVYDAMGGICGTARIAAEEALLKGEREMTKHSDKYSDIISDGGLDPRNAADLQSLYEEGYNDGMAVKKQWVDLTDGDREECLAKNEKFGWWSVIDAIEEKLREKNGG